MSEPSSKVRPCVPRHNFTSINVGIGAPEQAFAQAAEAALADKSGPHNSAHSHPIIGTGGIPILRRQSPALQAPSARLTPASEELLAGARIGYSNDIRRR